MHLQPALLACIATNGFAKSDGIRYPKEKHCMYTASKRCLPAMQIEFCRVLPQASASTLTALLAI
jgi:hypothetical protein